MASANLKPQAKDATPANGITNEDLWRLIRRFNRQVSHVKALPLPRGEMLDLSRSYEAQFPQDRLQITIERFYASVVVKVRGFVRHTLRLRSWKEPRRTAGFCAAFCMAWLSDLLVTVFVGMAFAIIFCPPVRLFLFPPLVQSESRDHAIITTDDKPPKQDKGAATLEVETLDSDSMLVLDTSPVAVESDGSLDQITSGENYPLLDETVGPDQANLVDALEEDELKKTSPKAINQTMRILSDITDICEKLSNLFSPQPPYNVTEARLQLAAVLIGLGLMSLVLSSYMIAKLSTFLIGLGFFGEPIFQPTIDFLDRNIPDWKEYLDLEKTLLRGVPTNAQLTLTLLRLGENNCTPLTPPPSAPVKKQSWLARRIQAKLDDGIISSNASEPEAIPYPSSDLATPSSPSTPSKKSQSRKRWIKVFKFIRRAIGTAIKGHIAFDQAMALATAARAKGLIGTLKSNFWVLAPLGPSTFEAKFQRKRGSVVIDLSKEQQPILYFSTYHPAKLGDLCLDGQKNGSVVFQIPVKDIRELKKTEGLGWKGKLIVELAAGSRESADGLLIQGIEPDQTYHVTGIRGRNQLFNRLVALDAQFWEIH